MKRLSIKMRVTLWYALLMLLLAVIVLGLTVYIGQNVTLGTSTDSLVKVVGENAREIEFDDGALDVDDDFAYSKNNVTCVVYSADGRLLVGYLPVSDVLAVFGADEPLQAGPVRTITFDEQHYYVYDVLVGSKQSDSVWIRGITLAEDNSLATVLNAMMILLPLIVVVAVVVGYFISRRALKPVDKIVSAANAIGAGSELSRRIDLGEGKDEIHRLAATFDNMFARLQASFEQERRFTSDASHELRTPTAVIISQCEYALEHAETEQDYVEALETIQRQAARISQMTEQLLCFARLDRGTESAHLELGDLSELVQAVCDERVALQGGDIELTTDIAFGIQAVFDRTLLSRLVANLLSNAYKYGRPGGWIKVKLSVTAGVVTLSVADNGRGIAPENLSKIWNRFYREDSARSADGEFSLGLGLAMVLQIAQLHNARITVRSTPGEGSVFTLTMQAPKPVASGHIA